MCTISSLSPEMVVGLYASGELKSKTHEHNRNQGVNVTAFQCFPRLGG